MKKLNAKKNTNKPEIPGKVKKGYRIYVMAVLALTLTMSMGPPLPQATPLPSSTTSATLSLASSVRSA